MQEAKRDPVGGAGHNAVMDDNDFSSTPDNRPVGEETPDHTDRGTIDAVTAIERMDPADAVENAEEHADRMAARLEGVVGTRSEPGRFPEEPSPGEEQDR